VTVDESRILERIRRKLSDEETTPASQRWKDETLFDVIGDGLRSLYAARPSAFSVTALVVDADDVMLPASDADVLPVLPRFVEPLANYVAGTLLSDDADRADPDRGRMFLELWLTGV